MLTQAHFDRMRDEPGGHSRGIEFDMTYVDVRISLEGYRGRPTPGFFGFTFATPEREAAK